MYILCLHLHILCNEEPFLALGYHCYFTNGNGVTSSGILDLQIFQGVTKNTNECVIRCIEKIQESPDINGVTFGKSKSQCFCKIKMVKIAVSQDHETCYLSSKSMLVSIGIVLPQKYFHKHLVSNQKRGPEVF